MKKSIASLLCLFLATCCGCTGNNNAGNKTIPKTKVTVETRDESTGEQTRIHKFDEDGREYETQINFKNQSSGTATRDPITGVVLEYKLTQPSLKKLQRHSKYSADGKRLVWEESYYPSGKLQTHKEELANKDQEEQYYSETSQGRARFVNHPDGSGEAKYWLSLTEGKEPSLVADIAWNEDGSYHNKYYAGTELGGKDQLLTSHDKEKDGDLIVCHYAAGNRAFMRSYWRTLTPEELRRPDMTYAGEWLLVKVHELSFGYNKEDRLFIFDGTPFQTSADKVEITAEDGTRTVIYKKSGAKEKAANKVEVYDSNGKLSEEPAATEEHSRKLHPEDPRAVQPPETTTRDWFKEIRSHFEPDSLISTLSKGK